MGEGADMKIDKTTFGATVIALIFSIWYSPVIADSTQATTAAAEEGGLETIIVTSRKRQESVQDVPVVITALSSQQIAQKDLTSLEKVAAITPDLSFGRNNGVGGTISM